jgi:nucleoside-triphosphatase
MSRKVRRGGVDDLAKSSGEVPRILLTGRPGCGKTTVVRQAVRLIGPERCAGFYTEELREGGRRAGFDVVTVDGRRGPLARTGAHGPRVGRYGVDLASFERLGVQALQSGLDAARAILVIDEIGKMELHSERFVQLLTQAFRSESPTSVLGTVMSGRHAIADQLKRRSDVRVIEVTPENRTDLPAELAHAFSGVHSKEI